jgi:hypothetical protein
MALTSCSARVRETERQPTSEARSVVRSVGDRWAVADSLRSAMSCSDSDAWQDDPTFWDRMNGYDCFDDPEAPAFVRVYEHSNSVAQILVDWQDTFGPARRAVRGANWFVIATPAIVDRISSRDDATPLGLRMNDVPRTTPREEYLTSCTRFIADTATRWVGGTRVPKAQQRIYDQFFPGVSRLARAALRDVERDRIRELEDDRRLAALSTPIGRAKSSCAEAYAKAGASLEPVDGSG